MTPIELYKKYYISKNAAEPPAALQPMQRVPIRQLPAPLSHNVQKPAVTTGIAPSGPRMAANAPIAKARTTPINHIEFYNAIVPQETGAYKNPWIRTKFAPEKGSTAFGPAQITLKKIKDYSTRMPKDFKQVMPYYNKVFLPQANNFNKYGREPNRPGYTREYDYGGTGMPHTAIDKLMYKKMAHIMMRKDLETAYKEYPNDHRRAAERAIALWRGVDRGADRRYFDGALKSLGF